MRGWRDKPLAEAVAIKENRKLTRTEQEESEREFEFQCRAHKLPIPHKQYHWARDLGRNFRCDFAWPQYRLLLEVHGGIWMPAGVGAHSGGKAITADIHKAQHAVLLRLHLLPVTTGQVKNGEAIDIARRALLALGWDGVPVSHRIATHQPELL
jgi:hypothetical protein